GGCRAIRHAIVTIESIFIRRRKKQPPLSCVEMNCSPTRNSCHTRPPHIHVVYLLCYLFLLPNSFQDTHVGELYAKTFIAVRDSLSLLHLLCTAQHHHRASQAHQRSTPKSEHGNHH